MVCHKKKATFLSKSIKKAHLRPALGRQMGLMLLWNVLQVVHGMATPRGFVYEAEPDGSVKSLCPRMGVVHEQAHRLGAVPPDDPAYELCGYAPLAEACFHA